MIDPDLNLYKWIRVLFTKFIYIFAHRKGVDAHLAYGDWDKRFRRLNNNNKNILSREVLENGHRYYYYCVLVCAQVRFVRRHAAGAENKTPISGSLVAHFH